MFVMDYYGHKLSNGVLFAHHLILDVPGGSSHLGYRRRAYLDYVFDFISIWECNRLTD